MSDAPTRLDDLYRQLVCERAGQAQAALAQEPNVERLFAASAQTLEDAAGVLLHAATAFLETGGQLPQLFVEQAGSLMAVAARFEEAADLSRSRDPGEDEKGGEP